MKCAAAGVLRACATIADDMSSKLNYVLSSGYLGRIDSPWSERLLCHQFVYKHMRLPLDGMKWEGENGRGGRTGWALAACRDRHEDSIACEMFRSQGGAPSALVHIRIMESGSGRDPRAQSSKAKEPSSLVSCAPESAVHESSKGSPTSAAPSKGKTADYPFDGSKDMTTADVVIQSRDGTRFFVHQAILSVASPVFRAYFTRTEGKARLKQDRRYFDLPEHSDVLDHLFRMIYPVENRAISKLPLVLDVWVTAHKYKMSVTEKALAERIRAMLGHGNELSVYAAACMMADEELARKAAEAWVKNTGPNVRTTKYLFFECISSANFVYVPRMVVCSAGAYYRLLRYILRCADPLGSGTAESGHTFVTTPSYPKSSSSSDAKAASPVSKTKAEEELSTLPSPDVIIRSKEGCGIFAHKLLLQLAGAASLMNEAAFNDPDDPSTAPLPVHPTSLSTPVLKKLILLSYPSTIYDVHDIALSEIAPLVVAARRSAFKLIKHEAILKERLSSLTTKEPLRTYFVAEQLGWEDIAEQAARQTTGMNIEELYVPEMEEVSAAAYYKLVKFHHQCQLAVLRTDADYKPSEHPTLRPVRLSILSLLGMQSPFKTVPVALAAQVQLDRTQTRTADGTQQSPRRWSEWPMMEHKMETIADEVSLRKGAIQRALSAVHLEKKTQDGVAK